MIDTAVDLLHTIYETNSFRKWAHLLKGSENLLKALLYIAGIKHQYYIPITVLYNNSFKNLKITYSRIVKLKKFLKIKERYHPRTIALYIVSNLPLVQEHKELLYEHINKHQNWKSNCKFAKSIAIDVVYNLAKDLNIPVNREALTDIPY